MHGAHSSSVVVGSGGWWLGLYSLSHAKSIPEHRLRAGHTWPALLDTDHRQLASTVRMRLVTRVVGMGECKSCDANTRSTHAAYPARLRNLPLDRRIA